MIIEFIGPPASGKSTLSEDLHRAIPSDIKSVRIHIDPANLKQYLSVALRMKAQLCYLSLLAWSVGTTRALGDRQSWIQWARRTQREWIYCAAWRAYLNAELRSYEVVISDSRLLNKFILEGADPRNSAGERLWPLLFWWVDRLPDIEAPVIVSVRAEVEDLLKRASLRTRNIVRRGLSSEEREQFYRRAVRLQGLVEKRMMIAGNPCFTLDTRGARNVLISDALQYILTRRGIKPQNGEG